MKEGVTAHQRVANEYSFFHSAPWKEQKLDDSRVGISKLKEYLQQLLDRHIEQELPKVRDEIKDMIKKIELEIVRLPTERPTTTHLRMYLTDLATQYHNIVIAALSGDYHTTFASFFSDTGDEIGPTRLRALVHSVNTGFSGYMLRKGRKLQLYDSDLSGKGKAEGTATRAKAAQNRAKNMNDDDEAVDLKQHFMTKQEMREWVKKVIS